MDRSIVKEPEHLSASQKKGYGFFKRALDIFVAVFGCLFLLPLSLFLWIAERITGDRGAVFYVQNRIGLRGKEFRLYKFRSMVEGADGELNQYLSEHPSAAKEYRTYRKLRDDPRITPVGRFIRRTSLDEFPQFLNILKGDMSLVGPRPYLPAEKRAMGQAYATVIQVKPGLTGPWQVGGRNEIPFKERLKIDEEYVATHSFRKDLRYFFQTFLKIFRSEGAL